jgi:hypothetical protein
MTAFEKEAQERINKITAEQSEFEHRFALGDYLLVGIMTCLGFLLFWLGR